VLANSQFNKLIYFIFAGFAAPYTDGKFSRGKFMDLTMEMGNETSLSIATLDNMTKKTPA
jgi:hypothetical protein